LDFVTFSSCDFRSFMPAELPIMSVPRTSCRLSCAFSRRRREVSIARRITTISWSMLKGFSMKS
jgi:hypothetical protein